MRADQVDALLEAAADGVAFDGLRVRQDGDGYAWAVDDDTRTGLSAAAVRKRAQAAKPYVTNWAYWHTAVGADDDARYAFLRWLERAGELDVPERYEHLADGMSRTWGQLSVRTHMTDHGQRRHTVCHVADQDRSRSELEEHSDPASAREIARFDDRGRYRPLRTAPTLATGWVFSNLGPDALLETVEACYPATIANWHREHNGELDVSHWTETAARQSGMYADVGELSPAALTWATEACCVDDACLKRRAWDLDADTEINVPRGDGEFPCREPCSLFIAAAREWLQTEQQEPATYTLELTPTETAQLEAVIDVIADDAIEDVRAGDLDDPANWYRVRYLRAKLFADDAFADEVLSSADESAGVDEQEPE